jgi:hypothetical protein
MVDPSFCNPGAPSGRSRSVGRPRTAKLIATTVRVAVVGQAEDVPNRSILVEDVFLLTDEASQSSGHARATKEPLVTSLRSSTRSVRSRSRVSVVDVHSRPGRISLVLGDVDRSEVAVDDTLRFLERLP